jgi:hypothetical protein
LFQNTTSFELDVITYLILKFQPSYKILYTHIQCFFFILDCEAIGTAAIPGLLCQPRVIMKMIMEKQMECRLCRGNRGSRRENLLQRHFCPSQNPTSSDPGLNPGRHGGKPATNRLSYGGAL